MYVYTVGTALVYPDLTFDTLMDCEDYIYHNKVSMVKEFIDEEELIGFEWFCEMSYE
tara:strand:- start:25 stop:195 length:171 start_codon:yes stop_codon:yes gene_type:complete